MLNSRAPKKAPLLSPPPNFNWCTDTTWTFAYPDCEAYPKAERVKTTFVSSRFSYIRKETTSFLVVPKINDQKRQYMTRNDQKWIN